jgi:hypothetical protein
LDGFGRGLPAARPRDGDNINAHPRMVDDGVHFRRRPRHRPHGSILPLQRDFFLALREVRHAALTRPGDHRAVLEFFIVTPL